MAPAATLTLAEMRSSSGPADLLIWALTWVVTRIRPGVVNDSAGTAGWPGAARSQAGLQAAARAGPP